MSRLEYAQDDGVIYEDDKSPKNMSLEGLRGYIRQCVMSRIDPDILNRINESKPVGKWNLQTDIAESVMRYIITNKNSIVKGLQNYGED